MQNKNLKISIISNLHWILLLPGFSVSGSYATMGEVWDHEDLSLPIVLSSILICFSFFFMLQVNVSAHQLDCHTKDKSPHQICQQTQQKSCNLWQKQSREKIPDFLNPELLISPAKPSFTNPNWQIDGRLSLHNQLNHKYPPNKS